TVFESMRVVFFFSSRRRHTRLVSDWSSDVCSSDLGTWWVGSGAKFDPEHGTVPMPAGSFVTHFGKQVHWDGAKDEDAVLLIMGRSEERRVGKEGRTRWWRDD